MHICRYMWYPGILYMLSYCYPDGVAFQPDYLNNQAGLRPYCRIGGDWTGGYNGLAVITDCPLSIYTKYTQNTHIIHILCPDIIQTSHKYCTDIVQILYRYYTHTSMGLGVLWIAQKKIVFAAAI